MPKDILPKVTFCPKTSCPIWQFAHEDILPKDFLPKLTICPKKTNCPRQHFAHILEDSFPRIFIINPNFWGIIADSFYDNAAENKLDMHFKPHKHKLYLFNREIEKKDKTEQREREREDR